MTTIAEPRPVGTDECPDTRETGWFLVRAAQEGNTVAFGRLYERYRSSVYGYVRLRVADSALAEDLTSETFARAFAKIGSFVFQGKNVRAWLFTIARNLVIDHAKSKYARTMLIDDFAAEWDRPAAIDVESAVVLGHVVADLCEQLETLTAGQRECLRLRFGLGYTVAETAAAMSRDVGAVRQLQHRAVARLCDSMREAWA